MTATQNLTESFQSRESGSRREFLFRLSPFSLVAFLMPLKRAFASATDQASGTTTQWRRIQRGLPSETLKICEKIANKLAPRTSALLVGQQWDGKILKAVVDELQSEGIHPDRKGSPGTEADRLRAEAGSRRSTQNATSASIAAAAAVVADIPPAGPIIAAILAALAAVIILIGQVKQKALEEQARARKAAPGKEKENRQQEEDQLRKIRTLESRLVKLMVPLDDCALFGKNCK
jgi:hypothetical protein